LDRNQVQEAEVLSDRSLVLVALAAAVPFWDQSQVHRSAWAAEVLVWDLGRRGDQVPTEGLASWVLAGQDQEAAVHDAGRILAHLDLAGQEAEVPDRSCLEVQVRVKEREQFGRVEVGVARRDPATELVVYYHSRRFLL